MQKGKRRQRAHETWAAKTTTPRRGVLVDAVHDQILLEILDAYREAGEDGNEAMRVALAWIMGYQEKARTAGDTATATAMDFSVLTSQMHKTPGITPTEQESLRRALA